MEFSSLYYYFQQASSSRWQVVSGNIRFVYHKKQKTFKQLYPLLPYSMQPQYKTTSYTVEELAIQVVFEPNPEGSLQGRSSGWVSKHGIRHIYECHDWISARASPVPTGNVLALVKHHCSFTVCVHHRAAGS